MAFFSEDISINTIIGNGSSISGDVKINGFARIDGDLDGNLEASGNIIIGEKSRIKGDIVAKSITVGGVVKGNIIALNSVHLLSSSTVIGDIQTHHLVADDNVFLMGHCISISDEEEFNEAVRKRENIKAISSNSIIV